MLWRAHSVTSRCFLPPLWPNFILRGVRNIWMNLGTTWRVPLLHIDIICSFGTHQKCPQKNLAAILSKIYGLSLNRLKESLQHTKTSSEISSLHVPNKKFSLKMDSDAPLFWNTSKKPPPKQETVYLGEKMGAVICCAPGNNEPRTKCHWKILLSMALPTASLS